MRSKRGVLAWIATAAMVAAALALLPQPAVSQQQAPPDKIEFETGQRIDSSVCGTCHVDIYDAWQGSVHAQSFLDRVFQHGLAEAITLQGPGVARTCLSCHSPATMLLDPQYEQQPYEGVNCQFCHILRGTHEGEFPPFDIDRELVMYGPLATAESPVHQTVYSEFLQSAEYCAACHEYTTPAGGKVLATFSEYNSGSYPSLAECQACHMPLVPGLTVDPAAGAQERPPWIDYHGIEGGRDIDQLRRAVGVEVVEARREGGSVAVEISLENRAAGHYLPTGMPSRRMVLEVSTHWEEHIEARSVVFGRRILDIDNNALTRVAEMMLYGAKVVGDTRLPPGTTRTLTFQLSAPFGVATELHTRLYYESTELPTEPPVTSDVVHLVQRVE